MESKFKIGDRVAVNKRIVGVVKKIFPADKAKYIYVIASDKGVCGTAWECELEDSKTAFLSELKALLTKYDAHLIAHKTDMPVSVYFEGKEKPFAAIGKETNKGCGVVISADKIKIER